MCARWVGLPAAEARCVRQHGQFHRTDSEAVISTNGVWAAVLNIWFFTWAVRHGGEFDLPLDSAAKALRWTIAAVCLGLTIELPQLVNPPTLRLCLWMVGLAFLAWPNFAVYLARLLRRAHILRGDNAQRSAEEASP